MNTLDFLREFQRICVSYGDCDGCPLCNNCILETPMYTPHMPEEELTQFINGVENWSRNHPIRIDWTKVPRNTPVLVCNSIDEGDWERQYFCAALMNSMSGNFLTFCGGDENDANGVTYWRYCRLAPEVDITPYLKEEGK